MYKNIFIIYKMDDKFKKEFIQMKKERREIKRSTKRTATPEEVIFIFEKILKGWKTIKIYNNIIQNNPKSLIDKKKVEKIATGNCKIFENELSKEKYTYYLTIREKVYNYHNPIPSEKTSIL
jgi:DNA-binding ferritin-like protein (Dps family)